MEPLSAGITMRAAAPMLQGGISKGGGFLASLLGGGLGSLLGNKKQRDIQIPQPLPQGFQGSLGTTELNNIFGRQGVQAPQRQVIPRFLGGF